MCVFVKTRLGWNTALRDDHPGTALTIQSMHPLRGAATFTPLIKKCTAVRRQVFSGKRESRGAGEGRWSGGRSKGAIKNIVGET